MNEIIEKAIDSFRRNNIQGYYVSNKNELIDLLKKMIPENSTIGSGDSITLEQLGVFDYLRNSNVMFYDKHKKDLTSDQKREIYLENFRADIFISGSNAITAEGAIINIDGNGSRVAPMLYGPQKVILIVGTNKLTNNMAEGLNRVRQISAPLDAKRLKKNAPCVKLGRCIDCKSADRICNDFVIISRQFDPNRIHVIIVEGDYGY